MTVINLILGNTDLCKDVIRLIDDYYDDWTKEKERCISQIRKIASCIKFSYRDYDIFRYHIKLRIWRAFSKLTQIKYFKKL